MNYDKTNIKVSFSKGSPAEFFVNEQNKTVACKLPAILTMPWGGFQSHIFWENETIVGTGLAKCSDVDTFDVDKGKRIALARAENDVYSIAASKAKALGKEITQYLGFCEDFIEKSKNCRAHNSDYIKYLGE